MNYEDYDQNLSPEEKEMFDELVREEMEKLEREFKAKVSVSYEDDFDDIDLVPPHRSGPGITQNFQHYEKRTDSNTFEPVNPSNPTQSIRANRATQPRTPPEQSDGLFGSLSNSGNDAGKNSKRVQQQEYARQLLDQQGQKKSVIFETDNHQPRPLENRRSYQDSDNQNSFSIGASVVSEKKQKQVAYAKQLEDDKKSQQFPRESFNDSRHSNGSRSRPIDSGQNPAQSAYPAPSPKTNNLNGVRSSIFGGHDDGEMSESEMRRINQKKYYDELTQAKQAAPISTGRAPLRRPPSIGATQIGQLDSAEDFTRAHSQLSLNSIGQNEMDANAVKRQRQQEYARQLAEASQQVPISQSHSASVRNRRSGADDYPQPSPQSSYQPNGSLAQQGSVASIGRSDMDIAAKKRLAQLEYSRQLQEDAHSKPIASPRSTLAARNRHLSPPRSPIDTNQPSGLFASGLSPRGPNTSAAIRRDQQKDFMRQLNDDSQRPVVPLRRTSALPPAAGDYGGGLMMDSLAHMSAAGSTQEDSRQREKQQKYARELALDRETRPIEQSRAPYKRAVSPVYAGLEIGYKSSPGGGSRAGGGGGGMYSQQHGDGYPVNSDSRHRGAAPSQAGPMYSQGDSRGGVNMYSQESAPTRSINSVDPYAPGVGGGGAYAVRNGPYGSDTDGTYRGPAAGVGRGGSGDDDDAMAAYMHELKLQERASKAGASSYESGRSGPSSGYASGYGDAPSYGRGGRESGDSGYAVGGHLYGGGGGGGGGVIPGLQLHAKEMEVAMGGPGGGRSTGGGYGDSNRGGGGGGGGGGNMGGVYGPPGAVSSAGGYGPSGPEPTSARQHPGSARHSGSAMAGLLGSARGPSIPAEAWQRQGQEEIRQRGRSSGGGASSFQIGGSYGDPSPSYRR